MKHFFKVAFIFTGIIIAGLIGVFLVSYFGENDVGTASDILKSVNVAK